MRCYSCSGFGHKSQQCWNTRRKSMMRTSHSMARRRNEVRKGYIFEKMDAHSSSSKEKGHLQKWLKKTEQLDQNESVKNLNRSEDIITTNIEYTIDLEARQKTPHFIRRKPLRQGNTIQWILLWKGSSPVHLPLRGGILLLSYCSKYNTSLHVSLHCLKPFIQCYHNLRTFQRRNLLEVEPSKKSSYIYYILLPIYYI